MRPIVYGILIFIGSGLVWVVSSFGAATQQLTGKAVTAAPWVYLSGAIFFFCLPVAIGTEIVRWIRRRKR